MNQNRQAEASRAPGRVIAVIVTHQPDLSVLKRVIVALTPQVAGMVVVDNGSDADKNATGLWRQVTHWIQLHRNLGIARAQNEGIEWARGQGADHILLMDQDSEPAPDMVRQLLTVAQDVSAQGIPLALVAPDYIDDRQSIRNPFMHVNNGRVLFFGCAAAPERPEITVAIASGALIPIAALDAVGSMRESLFIDLVDIEWCFRARSRGLRAFGVCAAKLSHSLGEQPARLFGRALTTHNPLRAYYFFRNAVWLFQQARVPLGWKQMIARQMLKRYLVFPVLVAPRLQYLKMMTLGVWHGLRGRDGAL